MSTPNNPDFTLDSKRKIAEATRRVLSRPANNVDRPRPAHPAAGGGPDLAAQYDGMLFQAGADLVVAAGYFRLVNAPAT